MSEQKAPQAYYFKRVRKSDTEVFSGVPITTEDIFTSLYSESLRNPRSAVIEPKYNPLTLWEIANNNNVLSQCIEAMKVNIPGTGWEIRRDEEESGSELLDEKKRLMDFFKNPAPGMSFTTIRSQIREDQEYTGNGYLEILRNVAGEMVMVRHLESPTMRLLRLSEPRKVTRVLYRNGKPFEVTMWARERRFVQLTEAGGSAIYYKEYGSATDVNRTTGEWANEGEEIPPELRASEVIHFPLKRDPSSPYGLPRWINQTPSVLGSRKAEEFNLDFWDNGGLPPVIIFVEGGAMTPDIADALKAHISGAAKDSNRGLVLEVMPAGGSVDNPGKVNVRVERFGGDRTKDAMFKEYDVTCEEHVRVSFRLPAIFLGREESYNLATSQAAYQVAEAQVFGPERISEDEIINNTLCRELGATTYEFKSQPLAITDVATQLQALTLAADKVDGEKFIEALNDVTGLNLVYSAEAEQKAADLKRPPVPPQQGALGNQQKNSPLPPKTATTKDSVSKDELTVDELANAALTLAGYSSEGPFLQEWELREQVLKLSDVDRHDFDMQISEVGLRKSSDHRDFRDMVGCLSEFLQ